MDNFNKQEIDTRFNKFDDDVNDNSKAINELYTVVMGPLPGRTNGIKGDLKALIIRFDATVNWAHDIWNNKRKTECLGLEALKTVNKRLDAIEQGGTDMRIAKVNLTGVYVMSVVQLIGLVIVALIGKG